MSGFENLTSRILEVATARLGMSLFPVSVKTIADLETGFQWLGQEHADALTVPGDAMFLIMRHEIATFALAARLPTVYNFREHVVEATWPRRVKDCDCTYCERNRA